MIEFLSKMFSRCFSLILLISCADARKGQPRIFGGKDAETGQFPFVVMTLTDKVCTGSLIAANWVLTASHCTPDDYGVTATVMAGNANWQMPEQVREVKKYVRHPRYYQNKFTGVLFFDIGLFELEMGFDLKSPNVGLMDLSAAEWPSSELTNRSCLAIGYGGVNDTFPPTPAEVLQWVEMSVLHGPGACPCLPEETQNVLICSERRREKGICPGDSGGPLVCDGKLVGVASMIMPVTESCKMPHSLHTPLVCDRVPITSVHTFVDPYLDWIRKEMQSSASATSKPIAALITYICFIKLW